MEDVYEGLCEISTSENDRIVPKVIKGNMRTYFLDVHASQEKDTYITITESKKCYDSYGHYFYERHKVFLFKEDVKELIDGLTDVLNFMNSDDFDLTKIQKRDNGTYDKKKTPVFIKKHPKKNIDNQLDNISQEIDSSYVNIEFEDLAVSQ
jgi:hypothetical protein